MSHFFQEDSVLFVVVVVYTESFCWCCRNWFVWTNTWSSVSSWRVKHFWRQI